MKKAFLYIALLLQILLVLSMSWKLPQAGIQYFELTVISGTALAMILETALLWRNKLTYACTIAGMWLLIVVGFMLMILQALRNFT
jgi:hypothetical protein